MANLKQTGVRISQYQIAQVNTNDKKNKLLLNHNFITYAPSYFGTSTMNKNYQIPVQSLRDDFKGYVGVENAKGAWQNTIRFWSGNWSDTYENRENSYVYQWKYDERGNLDYIANKWGDEEDVDKVFLINNAPIPLEEPEQDPCPESNKFVNKKYIDDRFNGIRKITVTGETLAIRPYSCVYEYDTTPTTINIVDTETLQDGRTVAECIDGNILTFIIKFPANTDVLAIKANGEHNVKWSYPTEFQDIVKAAKENNNSDVWLQCYVGYTEDGLSIRCSSALHPMPGSHEPPKVTDKVTDGDTKVPTSDAVYDFVKEEIKPKLEEVVAGDTFIEVKNKNEVFVNTSSSIINDSTTVPTTKAVYDSIEHLIVSEEYDEIIFDLGNIFYEQINKPWVESMVILSRDNYVYPGSTFTILRDSLHIPHAEKHYPNPGTLTITGISKSNNPATPTITASGFELSDVAKNAISERLKYVAKKYSQDSLTLEIARLQQSVPRKAQWVKDAKDGNLKTALAFTIDDPHTTEILRMFFYYLDQENGRTWGADDSYSKKYMMPGLTFKCLSNTPSGFLHPSSTITDEYSYTYRTWLGKGNSDKNLISWNSITPNYINYFDWSNYIPFNGEDAFHVSTCWDLLVNKSSFDVLINEVQTDMESLIVSDEYNEFVFDLSNIFYEQINKQWCELIVTLSENEMEIPYKEKYYTNVGTLKISGITAGSNPASPSVTTTGFELESFVIDAIRRKLMNVAETGNQNDLNSIINTYQNDIPYKAAWVRDAKALNIPTQLAFRHSSYRTNEILRMFFYYLDQENGKTWGADDSYSKKFMVPGLTYKCLTRPDTTFPTDQYYSYVYNIWLGDRGNTNRTLIAWDYEPSYLTIGSYPKEAHGANWDGDSFTMPVNWDTLVNEQAWDSFITDYKKLKTNIKNVIENKEYLFDNFDSTIHEIGNHQVYTIVFSKKHFYTGKIETITLYHDGAGDYRVQGGYLAIQVYKEANNENEIPQIFYSTNSYDYKSEDKCYKFNFENCVLDDYAKVHLTMVRDTDVVPAYKPISTQCSKQEGETRSQVSLMRISCIKKNGSEGEENILDENDECGVYWDTSGNSQGLQNKLVRVSVNRISPSFIEPFNLDNIDEIQDIKDDISEHVSNFNEHVSNFNKHKSDTTSAVSHVTNTERTSWNSHPSDTVKHITADERTSWNSKISEVVKGNEYITVTNNNTVSVNVATTLTNDANTVPTTKVVYEELDSHKTTQENIQNELTALNADYNTSDSYIKNIVSNNDFVFNNFNPAIHTLGNHQGWMLVFAKKHFFVGKLLNILIPHDSNGGSEVGGGYLAIQVYKELNNQSEVPTTYYSDNSCDYIPSNDGYRYNFTNCILDDYAKVHLTIVKDNTVVPPYKPDSNTDFTKISKIRFSVIKKNGSEGEGAILGENDGCGVYWDTSGNIVDKLPFVAVNKIGVKLVENYDFSEEEEEDVNELKLVQETISFGESNINQNSNSNCYGITFIAQENATVDTLTIKTAHSGYFIKVENLYAIIHEEQEDGTKKEIASMETPVNLSSNNTQYKLTFYPFTITKDKKYFVEFIQKNAETGIFNETRTMVNLGLLNDTSSTGVLSQSSRSSWNVSYANQYSPIMKLSQEMFIMGNLVLTNDMQYPLSLVAKLNGEDATNIVLLKPFVTASTDINIESVTNGHVMGIILEKNENTVAGEHYLGIKTLYINKDTNEMKELLLHSPLTIIE